MAIVRARHAAVYPARFMLVAATNPCPCGYAGAGERCTCSESERARHRRRLSGPLLDRIDVLARLEYGGAHDTSAPATSSSEAREQVSAARERQAARLEEDGVSVNAHMDAGVLEKHVRLDAHSDEMLQRAREQGMLSARGQHRVLRVARTIADLDSSDRLLTRHLGSALALRPETALADSRAA